MKMYIPFGDWSGDGHEKYDKVLVDAPSMQHLLDAQERIMDHWGASFFDGYADQYEEPYLSETVWEALIYTKYPIERLIEHDDVNNWEGLKSLEEVLAADPNPSLSIEVIEDTFIWLLNCYGAQITCLDETEDIPMICNWTCHGFQTVGYGCFW